MQSEQSNSPWIIEGRFRIEAADRADAERALESIERTARRTYGSTTMTVHSSEAAEDSRI